MNNDPSLFAFLDVDRCLLDTEKAFSMVREISDQNTSVSAEQINAAYAQHKKAKNHSTLPDLLNPISARTSTGKHISYLTSYDVVTSRDYSCRTPKSSSRDSVSLVFSLDF